MYVCINASLPLDTSVVLPEAHKGEELTTAAVHKARSFDYWFASILLGITVDTFGKPPIPS